MGVAVTGTVSELKAQIWLLEQGYEVFANIKPSGRADMVAWLIKTDTVLKIDVKTVQVYHRAKSKKSYVFSGLGKMGTSSAEANMKDGVLYLGWCGEEDRFMWFEKR